MRLLDRYILRQFITTFVLLMLGIPLLFVITDITDNLDKHLARGVSLQSAAMSYVYSLPQFVFWALPIAALVATVFTIGNMTRHQEIAAAKAGGISFWRLMVPLISLAAVLSVAAVALGETIPVTNRMRAESLGERQRTVSPLRTNFVFQAENGRTLAIRRLDADSREISHLVIERGQAADRPVIHQTAQRAQYARPAGWTMENGFIRILPAGGDEQTFSFQSSRIPSLRETPEELLAEPRQPEEMDYAEISRFIDAIERSGGDTRRLEVERAQKIALPMAILVIVLFGAPLSTTSQRGGTAYGIGISLAITMVYLMLFKVGQAVGASGAIDPVIAAWAPNAVFLLAGLALMTRVRT